MRDYGFVAAGLLCCAIALVLFGMSVRLSFLESVRMVGLFALGCVVLVIGILMFGRVNQ